MSSETQNYKTIPELLEARGINFDTFLEKLPMIVYEKSREVLKFPKISKDSVVLGYKIRSAAGKHWSEPGGVSAQDVMPLYLKGESGTVFVVEGETDYIRLCCADFISEHDHSVLCVPGANSFHNGWVPLMRQSRKHYIVPDSDTAGDSLVDKIGGLLPGCRKVVLPRGEDVCSFLNSNSELDFLDLVDKSKLIIVDKPIRRTGWDWHRSSSNDYRDKLIRVVSDDVTLRKATGNEFKGLCPFHEENTPSFWVNAKKGLYRCWGCGAKGDVITYIQARDKVGFKQAIKIIKGYE